MASGLEPAADDLANKTEEENFETGMRQNAMERDAADADNDGKLDFNEFCVFVRDREEGEFTDKELKERFAAAVDVVGGDTLGNVIKSLKAGGSVACCGLVQSPAFDATVLPFILRGVNLLGVDSVEIPLSEKQAAWKQLGRCAKLPAIALINTEISLKKVPEALANLFAGGVTGHTLVKIGR